MGGCPYHLVTKFCSQRKSLGSCNTPQEFSISCSNTFDVSLQERTAALAEGKPAPALSGSADIRSLNMEDFKYANEQVNTK